MKHKHYDCIVAIAEGNPVEFSYNGQDWKLYKEGYHYSPIDSSPQMRWRIKKEPEIEVKYYFKKDDRYLCMCTTNQLDKEPLCGWDLRVTYRDGKEVKAEVAE